MIKVIPLVIFLHVYILANVFETDNYENKELNILLSVIY